MTRFSFLLSFHHSVKIIQIFCSPLIHSSSLVYLSYSLHIYSSSISSALPRSVLVVATFCLSLSFRLSFFPLLLLFPPCVSSVLRLPLYLLSSSSATRLPTCIFFFLKSCFQWFPSVFLYEHLELFFIVFCLSLHWLFYAFPSAYLMFIFFSFYDQISFLFLSSPSFIFFLDLGTGYSVGLAKTW